MPAVWLAWVKTPIPLCLLIGVAAALVAIRAGHAGEARYGRRIIVTEMLQVGRTHQDREMIMGGLAGYLMLICFALAGYFALT